MIEFYNSQVDDFRALVDGAGIRDAGSALQDFIDTDPTKISWSSSLIPKVARGHKIRFNPLQLRVGAYRPFTRHEVYFDPDLNHRQGQMSSVFPTSRHENRGFVLVAPGESVGLYVLATDLLPDLHVLATNQFFARWTYEPADPQESQGAFDLSGEEAVAVDGFRRLDNITDQALAAYRRWYGPLVTTDDVFAFVYGLLHSPDYRTRFAADLKRTLPHIPRIEATDFTAFRDAGQALLDLHINYEAVDAYPLTVTGDHPTGPGSADLYGWFAVEKLRWSGTAKTRDRTTIVYNNHITIAGIPEAAHEYMLGSRSALEWILDRYQVRTDKPSGIRNDPNDYSREVNNPRYILDLIAKVTTVSVRTVEIVNALPPLRITEDQA